MKKLTYLITTAGGALAGYLFSNKKLRTDLRSAKSPEEAAKTFGKYLKEDGKKIKAEATELLHSKKVQDKITSAKKIANEKLNQVKDEMHKLSDTSKASATKMIKNVRAKATKKIKPAVKKAKKQIA